MTDAPLAGLRVLERAGGIAAPYAGRLLAMLGATVVKEEPAGGDPARTKPLDRTPLATDDLSSLFIHLNAGKRNVAPGTMAPGWADVVITNAVQGDLAGTDLDPTTLAGRPDPPLLITTSAWGFEAEHAGSIEDELLVLARSGAIAATGNPGREPLRLPGWQSQYSAGATAAVMALVGLRLPGVRHLDVPWLAAAQFGTDLEFADRFGAGQSRPPSGPFPPSAFPGGALPCADGHVCPGSYRDIDWEMQSLFYEMPELYEDPRYSTRHARAERVDELWELIEPWYAARTKREIFQYCLDSPWTVGMVLTAADALTDEHLEARQTIQPSESPVGSTRGTVRPFVMPEVPVADQLVRGAGIDDSWAATVADEPRTKVERRPLEGLRILELTVAWAGPFAGNLLGGMGADVIRIEATNPFEGYRLLRLQTDSDTDEVKTRKGTTDYLESSTLFAAANRNKRGLVLNLSTDEGKAVFKDMAAEVDVVLCNFTSRVLPSLGFDFETLRSINPGIVVVRMPAFGNTGPFAECAGYALIVEAMAGFGARFGYADEGARVSDTYWPDSVAGTHAALAIMTGIERRDRTGEGAEIDLSHQDAMWQQLGEDLIETQRRGSPPERLGNEEPGVPGSGIESDGAGGWVAVVGDRREPVLDPLGAATDPRQADRFEVVEREVLGPHRLARSPVVVDGAPVSTRRPGPMFDEHTDDVLTEVAGYDAARIADLREAGVVGGVLPIISTR